MTDLKFKILETLYVNPKRSEALTTLASIGLASKSDIENALFELRELGYISLSGLSSAWMTPSGAIAYENAKEEREKHSEDKKQQSFDNKMAIASVLISLISFFSGVIVESKINLLDWILSLFH